MILFYLLENKDNLKKRKLMDSSRLSALGFQPKTDLKTGISLVYQNYLKQQIAQE
jgi:nucleoside-diphosphate-sugar epimerase